MNEALLMQSGLGKRLAGVGPGGNNGSDARKDPLRGRTGREGGDPGPES